jgi:hypothetical protein
MVKRPGLIERGWLTFAEHVLPKNVGPVQRQEMRRAFYSGAGLLFENMTNAVGPDEVSEDAGLDIMASVDAEIRAFLEDVKRGRA